MLTYAHATHRGLKRLENQDAVGTFPREPEGITPQKGQLFIVADGMGGHQGGREASQMAVHLIEEEYFKNHVDDIPRSLKTSFDLANDAIYERASSDPALHGMGTTSTALVVRGDHAYIAHIGDSRAYRITEAGVEQITQDHSQVEELVRRNILTREQAERHPQRNVLSRAMGVQPEIEIDLIGPFPVRPGEYYLLCSDGLARVPLHSVQQTVLSHHPQEACDLLVQAANAEGGHDNVTVQIVRIDAAVPPPSSPSWIPVAIGLLLTLVVILAVLLYTGVLN